LPRAAAAAGSVITAAVVVSDFPAVQYIVQHKTNTYFAIYFTV